MRGSTPRANPLTEGEIGAVLGRIGLLASGDRLRCVPLDGGVSSDIWRIEIGARKYCLKRALAQLKVSQIWEAPIERNDAEWKWLAEAEAIWPGSVPRLVAHDRDAGLFIMEYLDPDHYELEEPTARRYPVRGNGSRGRRAAGRDPRRDGRAARGRCRVRYRRLFLRYPARALSGLHRARPY